MSLLTLQTINNKIEKKYSPNRRFGGLTLQEIQLKVPMGAWNLDSEFSTKRTKHLIQQFVVSLTSKGIGSFVMRPRKLIRGQPEGSFQIWTNKKPIRSLSR